MAPIYSFDTSTLVQSWRLEYRPKIFPAVWRRIEGMIEEGRILASSEVLIELERRDDDLTKWAKKHSRIFVPVDERIQLAVKDILRRYPRLIDSRRGRSGADPFVVAVGRVYNATVVTDEAPSGTLEKPKIPDVCRALGIECCRITDVFEQEGLIFGG